MQLVAGDTDGDFDVDDEDLSTLLDHFGEIGLIGGKQVGDFNQNGRVGDSDLAVLLFNYGTSVNPAIGSDAFDPAGGEAIPEPGSIAVLVLLTALFTRSGRDTRRRDVLAKEV
jgi:hypothetical protein